MGKGVLVVVTSEKNKGWSGTIVGDAFDNRGETWYPVDLRRGKITVLTCLRPTEFRLQEEAE